MLQERIYNKMRISNVFSSLGIGAYNYSGPFDSAIRNVLENHLTNRETWDFFVEQYRTEADVADLGWRGEYWGKMMRGAVLTYAYTKSEELYSVLEYTVRNMLEAQKPCGRFTTYNADIEWKTDGGWDMWCRKYVLLGFEYFLEICRDDELYNKIIHAITRHADRILDKVGDGKIKICETTKQWHGLAASSVLEAFVKLYRLTDDKSYLDFAEHIADCGFSSVGNLINMAYENKIMPHEYPVVKAYEMLSCFEGLLELYRETGTEEYMIAVKNFAAALIKNEITVVGCAGSYHELFNNGKEHQLDTDYYGILQETCVTVTWMKLCTRLLFLSGDAVYADCIENAAYNGMLGAVNSENVKNYISGFPFDSYSPLLFGMRGKASSGHKIIKKNGVISEYGCCASIGSAGLALIPLTSAFASKESLYVSLYLPGTFSAISPKGQTVNVTIDTDYPKGGTVRLDLSIDSPESFTIAPRIPSCVRSARLTVNGSDEITNIGFTSIKREWHNGDTIEITFDIPVRSYRLPYDTDAAKNHVAFFKGPALLARDARIGGEIDTVVDILEDENGTVNAIPSNDATFNVNLEYKLPQRDGTFITVIDYASAGKTYTKDSVMTAFLATKKYWDVDITRPLYIRLINYKSTPGYLTEINGEIRHSVTQRNDAYKWKLTAIGDAFLITDPRGFALTASENDNDCTIIAKEPDGSDAQLWYVNRVVQNRFEIISKKYGCHLHDIRWHKDFKIRLFAYYDGADERFDVRRHLSSQSTKSVAECLFLLEN